MRTAYYFEEIPMTKIIATEKELDKRLRDDEYRLALKCHPGAAFITVKLNKTNQSFVVSRARRWDSENNEYKIKYQILSEDCKHIVEDYIVSEHDKNQLFTVAVQLIRLNRAYKYFD